MQTIVRAIEAATTRCGVRLVELVDQTPVLLVFLRHAGCSFCREALADIGRARQAIEATGTRIVLVHLGDAHRIEQLLEKNSLEDVHRICDRHQSLYRAFGLKRGTVWQLLGPKVLWRGLQAAVLERHGIGRPAADSLQMPGVFLIDRSTIVRRFRHRTAADRPDYPAICGARLTSQA